MSYRCVDLTKTYGKKENQIEIFQSLNFEWPQNTKSIALVGESGSGKTSLLSIMAGLMEPDGGELLMGEQSLYKMSKQELSLYRAKKFGIIFQNYHLLPDLNVVENISLPLQLMNVSDWQARVDSWIERVGLSHRRTHRPSQLSGGEQQRVAIARAMVHEPEYIFADEPSGSLDPKTGHKIMDLIFDLVQKDSRRIFLVTHNHELAKSCELTYRLMEGKLDVVEL